MTDTDRKTFVRMTDLFPQTEDGQCRVCTEDVQPPLQKYCSHYCKTIAKNVQKLFSWNFLRRLIADRDGECVRCGSTSRYDIDHIIPVSKGGHPFDPDNLQRLCKDCHNTKGTSETDYRNNGSGGVRLFEGYTNGQLTMDDFNGDPDDLQLDANK